MDSLNRITRRLKEELQSRESNRPEAFRHSRLDASLGTSFIRLLDIQNNSNSSIIRCSLRDVDLDVKPAPVYEAASYSWRKDILSDHDNLSEWFPDKFPMYARQDATAGTKLIICNERAMYIHSNLYDFLARLRAKKRGLPIWIDAICIDQDETTTASKDEKMRQLQMMGRIYAGAETVLVWLGETGNISWGFIETLERAEQLNMDYEPYDKEYDIWKVHKKKKPMRFIGKMEGTIIASLTRLLNRDYFQRAWVVQELVMAKNLVFCLGSMELLSEKLLNGIHIIIACGLFTYDKPVSPSDVSGTGFRSIPHILKAQVDRKNDKQWPLKDFLFICRDREASRPEDKIFSLLGLVDSQTSGKLTNGAITDQGILLDRLYTNCAMLLAKEHGWPYVLTLLATGCAETKDLPSWVPDQRVPLKPKPFWYYGCTHFRAASSIQGDFAVVGQGASPQFPSPCLNLRVAYIDEIVQVGESHGELLVQQIKYAKGHILDLITKLGKNYVGSEELSMDAVMRTMTADIFERDRKIPLRKLRRAFLGWFGLLISNMRFYSSDTKSPEESFRKSTLQGRFAILLHNTAKINGTAVSFPAVLEEFLKMHDCPEYPWDDRLNGRPPLTVLAGEELIGIEEVEKNEGHEGGRARMVAEFESSRAEHFWRFMEQQIGGVAWAMNEIYQTRRIFRTKDRNMVGAGPRDIKLGDVVCLVAGMDTPFIFRRDGGWTSGKGEARVVGPAYLHGAMYGELESALEATFESLSAV